MQIAAGRCRAADDVVSVVLVEAPLCGLDGDEDPGQRSGTCATQSPLSGARRRRSRLVGALPQSGAARSRNSAETACVGALGLATVPKPLLLGTALHLPLIGG